MMNIRRKIALWICPELIAGCPPFELSQVAPSMSSNTHKNLTTLCDVYAGHLNVSHWRVSFLVRKDGQFFKRLRDGKSCTLKTADTVIQWFSDNWPADLEWPKGIPRPTQIPTKKKVA